MSCEKLNNDNESLAVDDEELGVLDIEDSTEESAESFGNPVSDALEDLAFNTVEFVGDAVDNVFENIENAAEKRFDEIERRLDDCYITTAICKDSGKPDDCYELTQFRAFRDKWLVNQPCGKALIQKYYDTAPDIVEKINRQTNSHEIYQRLKQKYLLPCLQFIEQGLFEECKNTYCNMVYSLYDTFGSR